MPYCPKCYSSDVSENSKVANYLVKGLVVGLGALLGGSHGAAHASSHVASEKFEKYHCNNCGHDFNY